MTAVAVGAQDESGARQVKRERDGSDKADAADENAMVEEGKGGDDAGTSSTEEVDQVGEVDEGDEEEQGSKRAKVAVVVDEADNERRQVQEELEAHAKETVESRSPRGERRAATHWQGARS